MTYEEFSNWAGGTQSLATVAALVAGGAWALSRFRREREAHPRIEFTADVRFVQEREDCWIVELVSHLENKGKVQHRIEHFEFDLFALLDNEPVQTAEQYGGQALFPHKVAERSWKPPQFGYFFIEPGVKAKYSYVARIPKGVSALLLHSRFRYLDGLHSHAAECTVACPGREGGIAATPVGSGQLVPADLQGKPTSAPLR